MRRIIQRHLQAFTLCTAIFKPKLHILTLEPRELLPDETRRNEIRSNRLQFIEHFCWKISINLFVLREEIFCVENWTCREKGKQNANSLTMVVLPVWHAIQVFRVLQNEIMRWMCVHGEPLFEFGNFGHWIDECAIAFASFIVAEIEAADAALAERIWTGVGQ